MQVNNVKNIYSTTPVALSSPPCAVGVPEEAPGKMQQYKRARVLDQYRQVRIVTLPTKHNDRYVIVRRSRRCIP